LSLGEYRFLFFDTLPTSDSSAPHGMQSLIPGGQPSHSLPPPLVTKPVFI